MIQVCQYNSCKDFQRSRRGKPGTVRDISPDDHVKTSIQSAAFFCKSPDNAEGVVGPVILLFICQVVKRSLHHIEFIKIHGIKM